MSQQGDHWHNHAWPVAIRRHDWLWNLSSLAARCGKASRLTKALLYFKMFLECYKAVATPDAASIGHVARASQRLPGGEVMVGMRYHISMLLTGAAELIDDLFDDDHKKLGLRLRSLAEKIEPKVVRRA